MSILIKGMKMPKQCKFCRFSGFGGIRNELNVCMFTGESQPEDTQHRMSKCPLIELPTHGRLIEESRVLDIVSEWCPDDDGSVGKVGDLREMLDEIEALPTIIPEDDKDINVLCKKEGE